MNSSNLINPFVPSEQRAWYCWLSFSGYVIGGIVFFLVFVSMIQWWRIYCLYNEVKILRISNNINVVQ